MKTRVDELFVREAARFSLRHACAACCHFDAGDGAPRCGNGWPIDHERQGAATDADVVFCKEFEMA